MGGTKGVIALLTQQRISYKFLDLKGIGKMPIHSLAHCIMVEEFTSTDSLKYLVPCLESVIATGETEVSNLYKTFQDLLL